MSEAGVVARKTWRTLEPIHGLIYFAAEAFAAAESLGLPAGFGGYFALRGAALGAVPAEVVTATFFNFKPELVRETIPMAWSLASPEQYLTARFDAAGQALRRVLGDAAEGPVVAEAAELARVAATEATRWPEGRPLFAAQAAVDWPDDPLLVLWHSQNLLREFRGDAHIAALVAEGVDAVESMVMHAASGDVPAIALQATRGWSAEEWMAGEERCRARGWLADDGSFTDAGRDHRHWVEDRTDELSARAYLPLGEEKCARLRELCRPLSKTIVASGSFGL